MNDYIVFFTNGFDKYAIDKQVKAFPNSYVSCIDSKPDYNILYNESLKAKKAGYNRFYVLWESSDINGMTHDMNEEFTLFKETGALPYKVARSLQENDISQSNNQATTQTAAPINITSTVGQTNTISSNSGDNDTLKSNDPNSLVNILSPEAKKIFTQKPAEGTMPNMSTITYDINHAASIFIWPINVYTGIENMRKSLANLQYATYCDNVGRAAQTYKSTSTVYTNKKGPWERIIYFPPSLPQLNQGITSSDKMFGFIQKLAFSKTFPATKGYASGNPMFAYIRDIQNKGNAGVDTGGLDEESILKVCRNHGALSANKNTIVIFCPASMRNMFSWCPRVVTYPGDTEPFPSENKKWVDAFTELKELIEKANKIPASEYMSSKEPNPGAFIRPADETITEDSKKETPYNQLKNLIGSSNDMGIENLYEYFQLFLQPGNKYAVPTSADFRKKSSTSSDTPLGRFGDKLKTFGELFKGKHWEDFAELRRRMGFAYSLDDIKNGLEKLGKVPAAFSELTASARDVINSLPKRVKNAQDKQEKGIPLSAEEEKLLADYNSGKISSRDDESSNNIENTNSSSKDDKNKSEEDKKEEEKVEESVDIFLSKYLLNEGDTSANTNNSITATSSNDSAKANSSTPISNDKNDSSTNNTDDTNNQASQSKNIVEITNSAQADPNYDKYCTILYMIYYFFNKNEQLLRNFFGSKNSKFIETLENIYNSIIARLQTESISQFAKENPLVQNIKNSDNLEKSTAENKNNNVSNILNKDNVTSTENNNINGTTKTT